MERNFSSSAAGSQEGLAGMAVDNEQDQKHSKKVFLDLPSCNPPSERRRKKVLERMRRSCSRQPLLLLIPIWPFSGGTPQRKLALHWNQISGALPMAYWHLAGLDLIELSMNKISGSLPDGVGRMKWSMHLHLAGNKLVGTLPAGLRSLRKLEGMAASCNEFSGSMPESITFLPLEICLRLEQNNLSGAIPQGFRIGTADMLQAPSSP